MLKMIRVQYAIYDSYESALDAGWPDAEFGVWITNPADPHSFKEGWIALTYEETN